MATRVLRDQLGWVERRGAGAAAAAEAAGEDLLQQGRGAVGENVQDGGDGHLVRVGVVDSGLELG